jgi:hypothetical protein
MNAGSEAMTLDRGRGGQLDVLRAIDGAVRHRVLVYGSLPPEARDLDLVVHPDDGAAIARALGRMGAIHRGTQSAVLRGCSVTVVDLIPVATLALPSEEEHALFAEATPLEGLVRVVEPSSHHALLILARRLKRARALQEKHRGRIARALNRDEAAWHRAKARATTWRAVDALAHLERLYSEAHERRPARRLPPRPRPTRWIAVCGADAGRVEFHARALHDALVRLGYDAVVERGAAPVRVKEQERPPRGARALSARATWTREIGSSAALWWRLAKRAGRGQVVISVVHVPDEAVSLPAEGTTVRLVRFLTRRPLRTYVLARNGARRHRGAATTSRVRVLDADRPEAELCRELFDDAWSALHRRSKVEEAIREARERVRRAGNRARTRTPTTLRPCRDPDSRSR